MIKLLVFLLFGLTMLSGAEKAHAQAPEIVIDHAVEDNTNGINKLTGDIDTHIANIDQSLKDKDAAKLVDLDNDLPMSADQTQKNVSYTAATSTQTGTNFYSQNDLSSGLSNPIGAGSGGTDESSTALKNMLISASNIQGMAYDNLAALNTRLGQLSDLNNALQGATDINQVENIKGQIAIQTLIIQAQEAQAVNLNAMASAQQEIDQHNREQAIRIDHQQMARSFVTLASGFNLSLGLN